MCFINKLPCDLQLIGAAFEHNALDLVFFYMDLKKNADVRLAFEAIKVEIGIYAFKYYDLKTPSFCYSQWKFNSVVVHAF